MIVALKNGFKIIRLSYSFKKNENWKLFITNSINNLIFTQDLLILSSPNQYFKLTRSEFIDMLKEFKVDNLLYDFLPLPPIPSDIF